MQPNQDHLNVRRDHGGDEAAMADSVNPLQAHEKYLIKINKKKRNNPTHNTNERGYPNSNLKSSEEESKPVLPQNQKIGRLEGADSSIVGSVLRSNNLNGAAPLGNAPPLKKLTAQNSSNQIDICANPTDSQKEQLGGTQNLKNQIHRASSLNQPRARESREGPTTHQQRVQFLCGGTGDASAQIDDDRGSTSSAIMGHTLQSQNQTIDRETRGSRTAGQKIKIKTRNPSGTNCGVGSSSDNQAHPQLFYRQNKNEESTTSLLKENEHIYTSEERKLPPVDNLNEIVTFCDQRASIHEESHQVYNFQRSLTQEVKNRHLVYVSKDAGSIFQQFQQDKREPSSIIDAYGDPIFSDEADPKSRTQKGRHTQDEQLVEFGGLESCDSQDQENSLALPQNPHNLNRTTQFHNQGQRDHPYRVIKQNQVNFSRKQQFMNNSNPSHSLPGAKSTAKRSDSKVKGGNGQLRRVSQGSNQVTSSQQELAKIDVKNSTMNFYLDPQHVSGKAASMIPKGKLSHLPAKASSQLSAYPKHAMANMGSMQTKNSQVLVANTGWIAGVLPNQSATSNSMTSSLNLKGQYGQFYQTQVLKKKKSGAPLPAPGVCSGTESNSNIPELRQSEPEEFSRRQTKGKKEDLSIPYNFYAQGSLAQQQNCSQSSLQQKSSTSRLSQGGFPPMAQRSSGVEEMPPQREMGRDLKAKLLAGQIEGLGRQKMRSGQKTSLLKNKKILMDLNQAQNMKTNSLEDLNSWNRDGSAKTGGPADGKAKKAKIHVQNRTGLAGLFKRGDSEENPRLMRRPSSAVNGAKQKGPQTKRKMEEQTLACLPTQQALPSKSAGNNTRQGATPHGEKIERVLMEGERDEPIAKPQHYQRKLKSSQDFAPGGGPSPHGDFSHSRHKDEVESLRQSSSDAPEVYGQQRTQMTRKTTGKNLEWQGQQQRLDEGCQSLNMEQTQQVRTIKFIGNSMKPTTGQVKRIGVSHHNGGEQPISVSKISNYDSIKEEKKKIRINPKKGYGEKEVKAYDQPVVKQGRSRLTGASSMMATQNSKRAFLNQQQTLNSSMGRYNAADLQHNSYHQAEGPDSTGIESGSKTVAKKALIRPSAKGELIQKQVRANSFIIHRTKPKQNTQRVENLPFKKQSSKTGKSTQPTVRPQKAGNHLALSGLAEEIDLSKLQKLYESQKHVQTTQQKTVAKRKGQFQNTTDAQGIFSNLGETLGEEKRKAMKTQVSHQNAPNMVKLNLQERTLKGLDPSKLNPQRKGSQISKDRKIKKLSESPRKRMNSKKNDQILNASAPLNIPAELRPGLRVATTTAAHQDATTVGEQPEEYMTDMYENTQEVEREKFEEINKLSLVELMAHPDLVKNKHYTFENSLVNTIKDGRIISKFDKSTEEDQPQQWQGSKPRIGKSNRLQVQQIHEMNLQAKPKRDLLQLKKKYHQRPNHEVKLSQSPIEPKHQDPNQQVLIHDIQAIDNDSLLNFLESTQLDETQRLQQFQKLQPALQTQVLLNENRANQPSLFAKIEEGEQGIIETHIDQPQLMKSFGSTLTGQVIPNIIQGRFGMAKSSKKPTGQEIGKDSGITGQPVVNYDKLKKSRDGRKQQSPGAVAKSKTQMNSVVMSSFGNTMVIGDLKNLSGLIRNVQGHEEQISTHHDAGPPSKAPRIVPKTTQHNQKGGPKNKEMKFQIPPSQPNPPLPQNPPKKVSIASQFKKPSTNQRQRSKRADSTAVEIQRATMGSQNSYLPTSQNKKGAKIPKLAQTEKFNNLRDFIQGQNLNCASGTSESYQVNRRSRQGGAIASQLDQIDEDSFQQERPKSQIQVGLQNSVSELLGCSRNNSNNELIQTQPFEPQKFDPAVVKQLYTNSMIEAATKGQDNCDYVDQENLLQMLYPLQGNTSSESQNEECMRQFLSQLRHQMDAIPTVAESDPRGSTDQPKQDVVSLRGIAKPKGAVVAPQVTATTSAQISLGAKQFMQKFNVAKLDNAMKRRSSGGGQKSIRGGQDTISEEPFLREIDRKKGDKQPQKRHSVHSQASHGKQSQGRQERKGRLPSRQDEAEMKGKRSTLRAAPTYTSQDTSSLQRAVEKPQKISKTTKNSQVRPSSNGKKKVYYVKPGDKKLFYDRDPRVVMTQNTIEAGGNPTQTQNPIQFGTYGQTAMMTQKIQVRESLKGGQNMNSLQDLSDAYNKAGSTVSVGSRGLVNNPSLQGGGSMSQKQEAKKIFSITANRRVGFNNPRSSTQDNYAQYDFSEGQQRHRGYSQARQQQRAPLQQEMDPSQVECMGDITQEIPKTYPFSLEHTSNNKQMLSELRKLNKTYKGGFPMNNQRQVGEQPVQMMDANYVSNASANRNSLMGTLKAGMGIMEFSSGGEPFDGFVEANMAGFVGNLESLNHHNEGVPSEEFEGIINIQKQQEGTYKVHKINRSPQKQSIINNFVSRNARHENTGSAVNTMDGIIPLKEVAKSKDPTKIREPIRDLKKKTRGEKLNVKRNSAAVQQASGQDSQAQHPFIHDDRFEMLHSPNNTQPLPKQLIEEAKQVAKGPKFSQTNHLHLPIPSTFQDDAGLIRRRRPEQIPSALTVKSGQQQRAKHSSVQRSSQASNGANSGQNKRSMMSSNKMGGRIGIKPSKEYKLPQQLENPLETFEGNDDIRTQDAALRLDDEPSEENSLDQLLAVDEESLIQGNGTGATDTKHEKSSNRVSSLGESSEGELQEMSHISLKESEPRNPPKKPPTLAPSNYPDAFPETNFAQVGDTKGRREFVEEMKKKISVSPTHPTPILGEENSPLNLSQQDDCSSQSGNRRVHSFSFGKKIGEGAYAIVKQATSREDNSKYAVKIYDKAKLNDINRQKSVRREVVLLQKMNHPNIVKLVEAFETDTHVYLVMENVQGGSLFSYLKEMINRQMDEEEARRIFNQILVALNYCHSKSIAHRDIKLENVLLDEHKNVKIIDFGFSTCIPYKKKIRMFCGTPSYMAPQIVSKQEYAGPPADIWACGVLLYALLNGCLPFKGQTDEELYRRIKRGSYHNYNQKVTREYLDILQRCLDTNADTRPSAADLLNDPWFKIQNIKEVAYQEEKRQFKAKILAKVPIIKKTNHTICILAQNPAERPSSGKIMECSSSAKKKSSNDNGSEEDEEGKLLSQTQKIKKGLQGLKIISANDKQIIKVNQADMANVMKQQAGSLPYSNMEEVIISDYGLNTVGGDKERAERHTEIIVSAATTKDAQAVKQINLNPQVQGGSGSPVGNEAHLPASSLISMNPSNLRETQPRSGSSGGRGGAIVLSYGAALAPQIQINNINNVLPINPTIKTKLNEEAYQAYYKQLI